MITRACKASPDWMRIGAVPGVLAGIVVILAATNTTLNIESFMGSIMCLGVSVSNSVMLVTFINDYWKGGFSSSEAAAGAGDRLRPILMTACAMTVGMVPMALALERGSQMQAPLGRAVIGGLVMSTFATLLVLPSVFAIVTGKRKPQSPSIYPDDPDSVHYDPLVFANEDQIGAQQQGIEQIGHESRETPASPSCHPTGPRLRPSAIPLHMLAMRAQRDYNAADTEGDRETSAKSLKSTSIQHQPNVRLMADAPVGFECSVCPTSTDARHFSLECHA
jgi:hypothetical protein